MRTGGRVDTQEKRRWCESESRNEKTTTHSKLRDNNTQRNGGVAERDKAQALYAPR